jgi:hypothetical protein
VLLAKPGFQARSVNSARKVRDRQGVADDLSAEETALWRQISLDVVKLTTRLDLGRRGAAPSALPSSGR